MSSPIGDSWHAAGGVRACLSFGMSRGNGELRPSGKRGCDSALATGGLVFGLAIRASFPVDAESSCCVRVVRLSLGMSCRGYSYVYHDVFPELPTCAPHGAWGSCVINLTHSLCCSERFFGGEERCLYALPIARSRRPYAESLELHGRPCCGQAGLLSNFSDCVPALGASGCGRL